MKTRRKIPRRPIPMTAATDSGAAPAPRKPRISYLIATAFGLGYLKPAPGTWGSLAGVALAVFLRASGRHDVWLFRLYFVINFRAIPAVIPVMLCVLISAAGVLAADRVAKDSRKKDPQFVVIDEVSGQWITLLLGTATLRCAAQFVPAGSSGTYYRVLHFGLGPLNWKYLLAGFILFRVFDIWKPFPVRQAESLPGGWGIMADDWTAALYAAACLWIARWLGL